MTYTYALLEVSEATFREIRAKLEAAGYQHAFAEQTTPKGKQLVIDMHGIALVAELRAVSPELQCRRCLALRRPDAQPAVKVHSRCYGGADHDWVDVP